METKKSSLWGVSLLCILAIAPVSGFADQKILSTDALKALISGKTVTVVKKDNGKQWKMYFSVDGKSIKANGKEGNWEINGDGEHCNTGIKLKCAKVADMSDGTYARLKPNGDVQVTWTKIEDGKHL